MNSGDRVELTGVFPGIRFKERGRWYVIPTGTRGIISQVDITKCDVDWDGFGKASVPNQMLKLIEEEL